MKLNKIEKLKLQKSPCDYYATIENLVPASITEADRFYLKNFGIYNNKQRPEEWMVRIRIPAGRIDYAGLRLIHTLAKRYDARLLLTARAQIELHRLSFREALACHKELEAGGLSTFGVLTDNFRNIVTDPLDGVAKESVFAVFPLIEKMQAVFFKKCDYLGMIPRKFNTAISAMPANVSSFFANDCYFALATKDGEYGFNLFLGGKNTELAQDADVFVTPGEVVPLYAAIVQAYRKNGLRASRSKARLYHLIEAIGMEGFKERMREFYPKNFESAGELLRQKYRHSDAPWIELRDGSFAYRYQSDYGEISLEEFAQVVELAKEYEVRIGVDQNLYIIGFPEPRTLPLPRRALHENVVCAGERYCIYSLFDTKEVAREYLKIDPAIRVGLSGCLKGCGRHILADIGFVGIRTNLFGQVERGVRLYFGGGYTRGDRAARLIFWAVPLRKLAALLEVIYHDFQASGYEDFEAYSQAMLHFGEAALARYYMARLIGQPVVLEPFEDYDALKTLEKLAFAMK